MPTKTLSVRSSEQQQAYIKGLQKELKGYGMTLGEAEAYTISLEVMREILEADEPTVPTWVRTVRLLRENTPTLQDERKHRLGLKKKAKTVA